MQITGQCISMSIFLSDTEADVTVVVLAGR